MKHRRIAVTREELQNNRAKVPRRRARRAAASASRQRSGAYGWLTVSEYCVVNESGSGSAPLMLFGRVNT